VKKLSKVNISLQKVLAAADRIFELLNEPTEVSEVRLPIATALAGDAGRGSLLEFRNLSFGYERDSLALRHFSLRVEPGEFVALVGHSGGGKSTVVHLLLRFYEPWSGCICVDGGPITEIPLSVLRQKIAIVPQDPFLFCGTIRENIAYATPGATLDDVTWAAQMARADDFIRALPQGYNAPVGERGCNFSGGQRQRIAIARALLRRPSILIFDEATSQLDPASEMAIRTALEQLIGTTTILMIAHRLSMVRGAHRIGVVEDGALVDCGSHHELLNRDGIYRHLYHCQFSESKESSGILRARST
jgi:subfamily B ATP-binding cassette protein MsbA